MKLSSPHRLPLPGMVLVFATLLAHGCGSDGGGGAASSDAGAGDASANVDGGGADSDAATSSDGGNPLPTSSWQSRGIGGGGALFVPEISPFDDRIFMATDMSGVFYTKDFGQSWATLNFRVLAGSQSAQIRFTSNPNTLFAIGIDGNGNRALYTSTNGGAAFTQLGNISPFYLEVDSTSTQRLVASDQTTLHYSGDGGATFHSVYTGVGAGLVVGGSFWDGQDIFVGTNDGLVVSHDGGASFHVEAHAGIPAGDALFSFAGAKSGSTTRFFAVTNAAAAISPGVETCDAYGTYRGIYKLDAGQSAWTPASSGLPAGHQPTYVRMARGDVNVAYVAGASGGGPSVAKTTNGGTSWSDVFRTAGNANIATGWAGAGGDKDWSFGGCAEGFAVSQTDSQRAIVTDMGFVHVTTDGGATWRQAYVDPADQHPMGASTPPGMMYRTAGVEQTSGWWLTWADPTTIIGSLTDITSVRSTNGGASWSSDRRNGLTRNTTYQVVPHPNGTLYAATSSVHDLYMSYRLADAQLDGGSGAVMASTDKGASWTTVHSFGHPVLFVALDPTSPTSLYATVLHSTQGGVFHTANLDSGASSTWTKLANPPRTQGHPYNVVVLKDGTLVATYSGRRDSGGAFTDSSGVFVSTDHGASWIDRSDPNMHYWTKDVVVDPNDATQSTWYVGAFKPFAGVSGIRNGLYRTTDRGQHWTEIWDGHNVESCSIDPRDPRHLFVTTESDGLWTTSNLDAAMPTFTADVDYPFFHPMRVFFNPSDKAEVWIASFGGGLRVRHF